MNELSINVSNRFKIVDKNNPSYHSPSSVDADGDGDGDDNGGGVLEVTADVASVGLLTMVVIDGADDEGVTVTVVNSTPSVLAALMAVGVESVGDGDVAGVGDDGAAVDDDGDIDDDDKTDDGLAAGTGGTDKDGRCGCANGDRPIGSHRSTAANHNCPSACASTR